MNYDCIPRIMVLNGAEKIKVNASPKGMKSTQLKLHNTKIPLTKPKKKLSSSYWKNFHLSVLVPKLDFRVFKLKIGEEYLIY